jgi:hypothetical protein
MKNAIIFFQFGTIFFQGTKQDRRGATPTVHGS